MPSTTPSASRAIVTTSTPRTDADRNMREMPLIGPGIGLLISVLWLALKLHQDRTS